MNQLDGKTALGHRRHVRDRAGNGQRFADEGAHVFITGRRQSRARSAVTSLGQRVVGVRGDVSDLNDLDAIYAQIAQRGHGLDVVFANAGGGSLSTLEDWTPRTSRRPSPSTSGHGVHRPKGATTAEQGRLNHPVRFEPPPPAALRPSACTPRPRPPSDPSGAPGRVEAGRPKRTSQRDRARPHRNHRLARPSRRRPNQSRRTHRPTGQRTADATRRPPDEIANAVLFPRLRPKQLRHRSELFADGGEEQQ